MVRQSPAHWARSRRLTSLTAVPAGWCAAIAHLVDEIVEIRGRRIEDGVPRLDHRNARRAPIRWRIRRRSRPAPITVSERGAGNVRISRCAKMCLSFERECWRAVRPGADRDQRIVDAHVAVRALSLYRDRVGVP